MLPSKVRCSVVEVFEPGQTMYQHDFSSRDLLPWADPYIAQLLAMHDVELPEESSDDAWESLFGIDEPLSYDVSDEACPPFDPFRRPLDHSTRRNRWRRGAR